jgi:hypothetical protein
MVLLEIVDGERFTLLHIGLAAEMPLLNVYRMVIKEEEDRKKEDRKKIERR